MQLDQLGALYPDADTPFEDEVDAVKRLLPYHIYQNPKLDLDEMRGSKGKSKATDIDIIRDEISGACYYLASLEVILNAPSCPAETKFALESHQRLRSLEKRLRQAQLRPGKVCAVIHPSKYFPMATIKTAVNMSQSFLRRLTLTVKLLLYTEWFLKGTMWPQRLWSMSCLLLAQNSIKLSKRNVRLKLLLAGQQRRRHFNHQRPPFMAITLRHSAHLPAKASPTIMVLIHTLTDSLSYLVLHTHLRSQPHRPFLVQHHSRLTSPQMDSGFSLLYRPLLPHNPSQDHLPRLWRCVLLRWQYHCSYQ